MKTNTILLGPINTGKTRSILTLLAEYEDEVGVVRKGAGLQTLFVTLEPNWQATIRHHDCRHGLHVHYINAAPPSWDTVRSFVKLLQFKSLKDVIEMQDPKKGQYTQFNELFTVLAGFVCDKCEKNFGDVSELDDSHAVFIDGMSPISKICMEAVIGGKPLSSKPEYYGAQGFLLAFLRLCFQATKCSVIMTAHAAREIDPNTGLVTTTIDTIGQRLTPEIIKLPDEIILTERERGKFTWSTVRDAGIQLKNNRLPEQSGLEPSFVQLFR